jgi:5-methylcytosine-specific restriction endonuclease McrA
MHIETDRTTGKIIYERKLKPGRGNDLYGLEVCESLGMPADFLQTAHCVRKQIQEIPIQVVADKWSRYNKAVNVDMCKVCQVRPAQETHHIIPQESASDDGFVATGVRVHRRSNLVPLCRECHLAEHHGSLNIVGYRSTSDGVELEYNLSSPSVADEPVNVINILSQRFTYDIRQRQWYQRIANGNLRRCKQDVVMKHVKKERNVTILSEEEIEEICSALSSSSAYTRHMI